MFSLPVFLGVAVVIAITSFLSGLFGMAGGMILMGVLLAFLPVPIAMVLHAITQMASNGWRAVLWYKYIDARIFFRYGLGAALALAIWWLIQFVPPKPVALIALGLTPLMARLIPRHHAPNVARPWHGFVCGLVCCSLQMMAGVSGPILDVFFVNAGLDRRHIVATKAASQTLGHFSKLIYFGALVEKTGNIDPWVAAMAVAMAIVGTTASRRALEAMSDVQWRTWTWRIITAAATVYLVQGVWLLIPV